MLTVTVSAKTDVGRARDTNEDACSITELASGAVIDAHGAERTIDVSERGLLLALSDGMGGHQAGEVASALVLETLQAELSHDSHAPVREALESAVDVANRAVREAAKARDRAGMGATLTAVFIHDREAYIAEVGDSRGYVLRNGRLRQVTRDQSLVQMLVDQGVMSAEEARNAPARNVILQAMGLKDEVRVAIARLELRQGDRIMLCSDGITNELTDDEIRQILVDSSPRMACDTMIALANERGGDDNQTVIVGDVAGDIASPVEFETLTSTFHVLQSFHKPPGGEAPVVEPATQPEQPEPEPPAPNEPPSRPSAPIRWIQSLRNVLSRRR